MVDVLDVDRALLDTGAAGGAGPQDVGVDDAVLLGGADERALGLGDRRGGDVLELLLGRLLVALHVLAAAGEQVRGLGVRVVAQRHDEELRGERLAGVPGGALRLAATALGAGREVEDALPGELLDLGDTEDGVLGRVLPVDLLAGRRHRLERAEGGGAVGVPLEPDVREAEEAVPGDTHVGVQRDRDHPGEGRDDLEAREEVGEVLDRAQVQAVEQRDQRVRGEEARLPARHVVLDALEGPQRHDADADDQDDRLDEVGLAGLGAGEAGLAARPGRLAELPDHDEGHDAEDRHQAEELGEDLVRQPVADDRDQPVGLEELAEGVDDRQEQREEAHRDEPVREADDAPAVHPGVAEEFLDQGDRALGGIAGAGAGGHGLPEAHEPVDLHGCTAEQRDGHHRDGDRHDDRGELHEGLLERAY